MPEHTELKSCPFCGYDLPLDEGVFNPCLSQLAEEGDEGYVPDAIVSCSNCGAGAAPAATVEEAIAAWNTRAPSPAHEAMKKALRDWLRVWVPKMHAFHEET